jgi:hypothetical protein
MAAIARSAQRGLAGRRVISGQACLPCLTRKEKPFTLAQICSFVALQSRAARIC